MRDCCFAAVPLRTPPYLFKHALVQDAAYSTLLRGRRQELHARVAAALEEHFADLIERQPELLAHHLTAAGDTERAVDQWLKAGHYAAGRLAHVEAIAHLERGLALLGSLPETPARDVCEIDLQLALGVSSITVKGMSSPSVPQAYGRARELAERRGDEHRALSGDLWDVAEHCGFGPNPFGAPVVRQIVAGGRGSRRRVASASPSQRLDHLFVCRRAGGRARALQGRAADISIPSGTVSTAGSMAGTTRAFAPTT